MEILNPKSQLNLFGYNKLFSLFIELFSNDRLPNVMLFSGQKGLGKSTFAYHFINYLLSLKEKNSYSLESLEINPENSSFKLTQNNIHPNLFIFDNNITNENIKIEEVRNLLKFLSKSTYSKDLKLVLINNAEYLNLNSSNALLKALEEPTQNTFYFIIHNDSSPIIETIKSRTIQFKFHLNTSEKLRVFKKIIHKYDLNFKEEDLNTFFYFETPGNLLYYQLALKDTNFDILKDILPCILYLIDKYKTKKDPGLLTLITSLVENFYNKLSLNNGDNVNNHFINKNRISLLINNMKKFNLDKNNLLININDILRNEA